MATLILPGPTPAPMTDTAERAIAVGVAGGLLLVLVGVVAYVATDFASVTALIPSVFGVMIVLVGIVGREPAHDDRSILAMGLLGGLVALGSARALPDVVALLTGGAVDSTVATVAQGLSVLVGLVVAIVAAGHLLAGR